MFTIVVANIKGGVGKSTVATHLAAHFAMSGERTVLGELDRQKTALTWLKRRPDTAASIVGVDLNKPDTQLPRKTDIMVVDAGAAMRRDAVKDVVKTADMILIPVLPSVFDEDAAKRFVKQISDLKPIRTRKRDVAFIGNRVRRHTKSAQHLEGFLSDLDFPVVSYLRDTQLYAHAAQGGISLFEMANSRVRSHLEDWQPLLSYVNDARKG